jgi:hypothetical protein
MEEVTPTAGKDLQDFPFLGRLPLQLQRLIPRLCAHEFIEIAVIFATRRSRVAMQTALTYRLASDPEVLRKVANSAFRFSHY